MKSLTTRTRRIRRRLLLLTLLAAGLAMIPTGNALAVNTTCTLANGDQFRTSWTRNTNGITEVLNLQYKSAGSSSFSNFVDTWGSVAKLEWWTPQTLNSLITLPGEWNSPGATLVLEPDDYATWWGWADQRPNIIGRDVYGFLSPKVSIRNNGSVHVRTADLCDDFLSDWPERDGPKVAVAGDSITASITKKLALEPSYRGFVEPQSGQSFRSMKGEILGLAAGLREPAINFQVKPDVLVMALGTNDAGAIHLKGPQSEEDAEFNAFNQDFTQLLDRTSQVQCRILTTVHESGWRLNKDVTPNQPYYDAELKEARQRVNERLELAAANDPGIELVDWAAMSATHGWYQPSSGQPWYAWGDPTHPSDAGKPHLAGAIIDAVHDCA